MATAETFAWLLDEMDAALATAGPVDAVLLALHGAMVAEDAPDVEGELLQRVRRQVGPAVPVVATLDLHANVTRRMVETADALVLYHTAPHIDVFETGERGAALLRRMLFDGARPVTAYQKVPAVFPAERANTQDPASFSHALAARLRDLEARPGVLAAGVATVQPWLDIPELGSTVVVIADDNADLSSELCAQVAADLWQHRRDYLPELVGVAEAVARAHDGDGLTVLSDSADATTSGAPGDSTHLLRELLRHDWSRPALVTLVDADLVRPLMGQPTGTEWTGRLGGKRDARFSEPLEVDMVLVGTFRASSCRGTWRGTCRSTWDPASCCVAATSSWWSRRAAGPISPRSCFRPPGWTRLRRRW